MGYGAIHMTEPKKTDPAELRRLREIDAAAAMAEYHTVKAAGLEKMAQLRALRLAKEAADRDAKPAASKTRRAIKRPVIGEQRTRTSRTNTAPVPASALNARPKSAIPR